MNKLDDNNTELVYDADGTIRPEYAKLRHDNAVYITNRINELHRDFIIYNEYDEIVGTKFEVRENGDVMLPHGESCSGGTIMFLNDTGLDNGMYTTIHDFNNYFDTWCIIPKQQKRKLSDVL